MEDTDVGNSPLKVVLVVVAMVVVTADEEFQLSARAVAIDQKVSAFGIDEVEEAVKNDEEE